ncbi:hypothetical protein KCP70_16065 [Salmonella enterica subsp. enterica]|nr:hypothetical protein KCP70_16065 [Salmonella enterica subsp. enterica]
MNEIALLLWYGFLTQIASRVLPGGIKNDKPQVGGAATAIRQPRCSMALRLSGFHKTDKRYPVFTLTALSASAKAFQYH